MASVAAKIDSDYKVVTGYSVFLVGNAGAVPSFNDMIVQIQTSSGPYEFQYNYQTDKAMEKISLLIDLLRNEKNVSYNPKTNTFAVQLEQVGEKDV